MMHDGKRHDRLYVRLLNVDVMLDMKYGIYIMPWEEYSMKYGIYIIPWEEYSDFNRTFAHSQFNKKNYRFIIRVISLTMSKMVPILERKREQWNGPRI